LKYTLKPLPANCVKGCNIVFLMTGMRKFLLLLLILLAVNRAGLRAQDTTATTESLDSLIALLSPGEYDSLMKDLDFFLGDFLHKDKSYFDIGLGVSNGFFTQRGADGAPTSNTINKLVLSPSAGYYHKSGLGIGWAGFWLPGDKKAGIYQQQLTASYDYTKGKKAAFGFSYTRQSSKDSLSFYASPFENIFSGYFNLRKGWLRPGLSLSYSNGSYTDVFKRSLFRLVYNVDVKDFTAILSVRHVFVKQKLFSAQDYFMFTPRLMLINSGQKYKTNSPDLRFRRAVNQGFILSSGSAAFQPQSLGLNLSADYMLGKFYVHPQLYFDYYLHIADKRFYTSALLLVGVMF
jgi:hypothetical protein